MGDSLRNHVFNDLASNRMVGFVKDSRVQNGVGVISQHLVQCCISVNIESAGLDP